MTSYYLSSVCLLLALVGFVIPSPALLSGVDRFLVSPTTLTSTVTVTTTSTSTIMTSTSCATLLSASTACRRRRAVMEIGSNEDTIQPAMPLP